MKARCLNPTDKDYPRYGGAGIEIYPEWIESFEAFFLESGLRPDGTTLDRIDTRIGYMPGNIRWATAKVQSNNKLNSIAVWTIKGKPFPTLKDAATHFGVSHQSVLRWVHGYSENRPDRANRYTPPRSDCSFEMLYE